MSIFLIDRNGLKHPTEAIWSEFGASTAPCPPDLASPTDFARLMASDLMTRPVITLSAESPLCDALELYDSYHFRHLPIVTNFGQLCGILSERDLFTWINRHPQTVMADLLEKPVSTIMTTQVLVVTPNAPSDLVLAIMLYRAIGSLPVIQGSDNTGTSANLLGIITKTNIIENFFA